MMDLAGNIVIREVHTDEGQSPVIFRVIPQIPTSGMTRSGINDDNKTNNGLSLLAGRQGTMYIFVIRCFRYEQHRK